MEKEPEYIKELSESKNYKFLYIKQSLKISKFISLHIIYIILIIYLLLFAIEKTPQNKSINLSEKIKLLKLMTNNNIFEYSGVLDCLINDKDNQLCIYHLISPKEVLNKNRILLGSKRDGSYVLLDDFLNIKFAYSFGINNCVEFDKELAERGIDVYMYDHTINSLPFEHPKFHWKKIGLCGKKSQNNILKSLDNLIAENGHINENNMILKIDIEFMEWESLIDLKDGFLNHFKYIVIEYHFTDEKIKNNKDIYYNVLKKIYKTHQAFYVRCNGKTKNKVNFGKNRICPFLEVSYIIRKDNNFIQDREIYPIYKFEFSKPEKNKLETNLNILKLFD